MDFQNPERPYDYTDDMKVRDEALYQFNLLCHLKDKPDEIFFFAEHLKAANSYPI